MDLGTAGRIALVSGASKGIGYATVESLAREGCHVHLAARTESDLSANTTGTIITIDGGTSHRPRF